MTLCSELEMQNFVGVSWSRERQKWMARIKVKGKSHFLGRFIDPVKAAFAYDDAARIYYGEDAKTNFQKGNAMASVNVLNAMEKVKTAKVAQEAKCPVCLQEFYDLNASPNVCAYHSKYFVTICAVCGKSCFSDAKGICPNCEPDQPRFHGKFSLMEGDR